MDLFYEDESAETNEIALYNALHDEPLPEGTEILKFRVEDILYMNFRNDISFGVGGKLLVFGEHQSTINENMLLRSLMYIGRAFEQLVPMAQRYKRHRVMLPKPEFYTFYNGEEHAFQNAVAECIEQGILADYLRKKGSEAVNMLKAEYDYDMDIKVQREEAKEEGIVLGERFGKTDSILALLEDLGSIPDDLKDLITNEEDTAILKKWLKLAALSDSIEIFQKKCTVNK